ncbi:MAG: acyl-CoA thioesterase [Pseudomonadota bacterium]
MAPASGTSDERLLRADVGEVTVRTMAMPRDTNWLGDVFGGWLMSHADVAGSVIAYRRAGGNVVTASVNDFQFLAPVYVGDVLSFFSRLVRVGTTSLGVDVNVYAERPGAPPGEYLKVAAASFSYVHIDDARRPAPVPQKPDGQ